MTPPEPTPLDLSLPQWRDDPGLLKNELLTRLKTGVVIDADLTRPADTLTVQLLLAARQAADSTGVEFKVRNASDPFCDGLRTLGLHQDILG